MKRNSYYTGKHLTAESFTAEQYFHLQKQSLLTHLLFGRIAVTGYLVSIFCDDTLNISPGIAFDGNGRLLQMTSDRKLPLPSVKGYYFQHTLTLYAHYEERTDKEYIEETVQFSFTDEQAGVPLADIHLNNGKIGSVEMRTRTLDSIFGSLTASGGKDNELYKQLLEKIYALQRQINRSAVSHGSVTVRGGSGTVLISDRIKITCGMEPFYVAFSVYNENTELLFGDAELFQAPGTVLPFFRVIRKAVKILPAENCFMLAIEIDKPVPGAEIVLRWIATGKEGRYYADDILR